MNSTPRALRVATFCRVAGCRHILPFIAGATKIFAFGLNASAMHVSASSARPCASLAMTFAVAGAMSSRSAWSASSMCVGFQPSSSSKRPVTTGCRESTLNGSGVMNRCASAVITTRTLHFCFVSRLARSAALCAAIEPVTPKMMFLPLLISRSVDAG